MKKEELVNKWSKDLKDLGFNNTKDWKYLTRRVRKKLEIKVPRIEKGKPETLKLVETNKLIEFALNMQSKQDTHKRGLIIETVLMTGLSTSQLMNLKYEEIKRLSTYSFSVFIIGKQKLKGFIPNTLLDKIDGYNLSKRDKLQGYVFFGLKNKRYTDSRALQHIIRDARISCSIKTLVNAFTLQNTFITVLLNEGINLQDLKAQCKDAKVIDIYRYCFSIGKGDSK